MENSFSFSRFGRLVTREYTQNRVYYLLIALVQLIGPWAMYGMFQFGSTPSQRIWPASASFVMLIVIVAIGKMSMIEYARPGRRAMAMTLPVSTWERYLFAWGNSLMWFAGAVLLLWGEVQLFAAAGSEMFGRLAEVLVKWTAWRSILFPGLLVQATALFCFTVFAKPPRSGYAIGGMVLLYVLLENIRVWLHLDPFGWGAYLLFLIFVPIFWVAAFYGIKRMQLK